MTAKTTSRNRSEYLVALGPAQFRSYSKVEAVKCQTFLTSILGHLGVGYVTRMNKAGTLTTYNYETLNQSTAENSDGLGDK